MLLLRQFFTKILYLFLLTVLLCYSLFTPLIVYAGNLSLSANVSPNTISSATNILLTFTLSGAIAANGYINIHFPTGTTMETGLNYTDVDVLVNSSNRTLDAYTTTTFSGYDAISVNVADPNNLLMQIVPESTGNGYTAGSTFTVKIGTNASYQHTGDKQYSNGSSAGTVTYQVVSRNVNNDEIDSGTSNVTLAAAAPEFSTYMYFATLIAGGWYIHRKIGLVNTF
jgi:hypothetical protein